MYLQLAADAGVGVDLHTDETLDPTADGLSELAAQVLATGFGGPVTASHCVSLGVRPEAEQLAIAEQVAQPASASSPCRRPTSSSRAATTNRRCRGRHRRRCAAARRCHGRRGCRQRAGPVQPARALQSVRDRRADDPDRPPLPAAAWACVSEHSATVLGIAHEPITVGTPADLVAVSATDIRQAIADGGFRPRVWRRGIELP